MPLKQDERRFILLEAGFLLVTILAPLAFGAVYAWAFMSLAAVLFLLFAFYPDAVAEWFRLPKIFRVGIILLFAVIILQIMLTSMNRYATSVELLKWSALACGFLLFQLLPQSSLIRWMSVLCILAFFESCYGWFQVRSGGEMVLWHQKEYHRGYLTGTYLNHDHIAGFLELSLGIQLGFWLRELNKRNFLSLSCVSISLLVSLAALFKTGSRMALLSFAGSLVIVLPILLKSSRKLSFGFIGFFLVLGGISFFTTRHLVIERFLILPENLQTLDGRLYVWLGALHMLKDHLWFGTGLGSFNWVFPLYQQESLTWGWSHAHNDYLELAVEFGIPAFAILLLTFGSFWWEVLKRLSKTNFLTGKRREDRDDFFPLIWGGAVSMTSLLLHGLTDFNFAIPANSMLLMFVMAATYRLLQLSQTQKIEVHA